MNEGKVLTEFDSKAVGAHTHVLQGPTPFVYNLHGTYENSPSWVFTHEELKALLATEAYTNFVDSILSTATVLFVGLSADDVAVGGHLERLGGYGVNIGPHYWVSSRVDLATDKWAERIGIRMIRYQAVDGVHAALEEMLQDLLSYVPPEADPAPPVVARVDLPSACLLAPEDLAHEDAEIIRVALNKHAAEILSEDSRERFAEFEQFVSKYDEAIHRAWYTSLTVGKNQMLGYTLTAEAARGAFGRVFRATAPNGDSVAIKLLHNDIREQRSLLLAFRRGVRAMSILADRGIEGVVRYRGASEIPAFVVMDWIDGANLKDAVLAKRLDSWSDILRAAYELANIISKAHATPERVLHRDIRPANIMLEGFWMGEGWRVIVLDFDLSWHREAYERSVIHGSGTAGYLAPEQIAQISGISSRHAAVDSFGMGMTFFFMVAGYDPVPNQQRHRDWDAMVSKASSSHRCEGWRSLPARFARLIKGATQDRQAERLDVSQIVAELSRLRMTVDNPPNVIAADMIAEEIAARAECMSGYEWDRDKLAAWIARASGVMLRLSGEESNSQVVLRLEWNFPGNTDWRRTGKWVDAANKAADALVKGGWHIDHRDKGVQRMELLATKPVEDVHPILPRLSASLDNAVSLLHFE